MRKCKDCKFWEFDPEKYEVGQDVFSLVDENNNWIIKPGFKYCKNPKLLFYDAPDLDGACVVDGSQFRAGLITGQDFGCVNFEEK